MVKPNTNRIGYKIGLERKLLQKPKEKDICPRFHPPKPIVSRYTKPTNRLNADKKVDSPKRNAKSTSVQAKVHNTTNNARSSVSNARQPLQIHKTNVKSVAK